MATLPFQQVYILIAGAASATQATAISNLNAAVATFMANGGDGSLYNPLYQPEWLAGGLTVNPDADVANGTYTGWMQFSYVATA